MKGQLFLGDLVSPAVSGVEGLVLVAAAGLVLLGLLAFFRNRDSGKEPLK